MFWTLNFIAFCISMSRIALGVHSWNQVIFGYLIGFILIEYLLNGNGDTYQILKKFNPIWLFFICGFFLYLGHFLNNYNWYNERTVQELVWGFDRCPDCKLKVILTQIYMWDKLSINVFGYLGFRLNFDLIPKKKFPKAISFFGHFLRVLIIILLFAFIFLIKKILGSIYLTGELSFEFVTAKYWINNVLMGSVVFLFSVFPVKVFEILGIHQKSDYIGYDEQKELKKEK